MNWAYWLLAIGFGLMVIDLTAAGLVEGQLWVSRAPWIDSVRAMYPYWLTRTVSGIPILAGFLLFWIGPVTGPRNVARPAPANFKNNLEGSARTREHDLQNQRIFHGVPSILGYAFVIAFGTGFGFFILSFVALGILPAGQLQAEIDRTAPRSMQRLTAAEAHGRVIYGREGCAYCHAKQVTRHCCGCRAFRCSHCLMGDAV
jgi:cytochrome c oxidase cbb3-type subunit I/II